MIVMGASFPMFIMFSLDSVLFSSRSIFLLFTCICNGVWFYALEGSVFIFTFVFVMMRFVERLEVACMLTKSICLSQSNLLAMSPCLFL